MKKIINGILIAFVLVTITGCGNNNKLSCTLQKNKYEASEIISVIFDGNKIKSAKTEMTFDSVETANSYYSLIKTFGSEEDVSLKNKTLTIKAKIDLIYEDYGKIKDKEDLKNKLENKGYTCK